MALRKKNRHSKAATLFILGVAFFLLFFGVSTIQRSGKSLNPFPETAKVYKVIDGDTIVIDTKQRVRYLGIDTPETRIKTNGQWQYMPEPFAEDAKEFNSRLVAGETVSLEYDIEKYDKYGRLLAYVRLSDGTFVNSELLRQGLAEVLIIPPNSLYADMFYNEEKLAREARKGIWSLR